MLKSISSIALSAGALALLAWPASAQDHDYSLSETAKTMLEELDLPADALNGLEAELSVPQEWIDKAKEELANAGPVEIRQTINEKLFAPMWEMFQHHYPWMEYSYFQPSGQERTIVPLMALKRENWIVDVIASHKAVHADFVEADLLADLSVLPAWDSIRPEINSVDNMGVGLGITPYCMGYNKKTVSEDELPETWDDLVDNPRWHDGKVGLGQNYTTWLPHLIAVKGEDWGDEFIEKIFSQLKPQFRKENFQMLPKLAALGEYDISVPSGDGQVAVNAEQGLEVGYHCPVPVPLNVTWLGVVKPSPRYYQAMIFANWAISKEGQAALYWQDKQTPGHKELGSLAAYPDEVEGKPVAPMSIKSLEISAAMSEKWIERWIAAGGEK